MKSDLLVDETLDEILGQFEVEHAFPNKFAPAEKKDGWLKRMWTKARSWFRRGVVADVRDQQDDLPSGGEVAGPGGRAGDGCRPSSQEVRACAKP